jgi:hypothetical protein
MDPAQPKQFVPFERNPIMSNIVPIDLETLLAAAPNTTTDSLTVTIGALREMQTAVAANTAAIAVQTAQIALLRSLVPGS